MSSELNIKQVKKDSLALSIFSIGYLILCIAALVQLVLNGFEGTTDLLVMIVAYAIMIMLVVSIGYVAYTSIRRYMSPQLQREKAIKNRDERLQLIRYSSNTMTLVILSLIIVSLLLIAVLISNEILAGVSFISMIVIIIVKSITEVYYKRKF